MIDPKYEHLKIKIIGGEFKYVLLETKEQFLIAVEKLTESSSSFATFVTSSEHSFICDVSLKFECKKEESGWSAMRIIGDMPFGTVQGLIANVSGELFKENIGICVVSTFLTDFFFVKTKNLYRALEILKNVGWKLET